jgi:hypothetical protein
MGKLRFKHAAMVLCVAAFSACGSGAVPVGVGMASRSWMHAEKKNKSLLYVSDNYNGIVDVYDYGQSRQVGAIYGFDEPSGQCVDKNGDVWVTEYFGYQAFEFAHGATKPMHVLTTNGSSIDPVTGNLAIGSEDSPQNAWGDIQVFPNASGSPTNYYSYPGSQGCAYMQAPGYDDKGNLYFEARWGNGGWGICELPANGSAIVRVPIAKSKYFKTIDYSGSVAWDGKYITFEDYRNEASQNSVIYQAERRGSKLVVVGSTTLGATCRYANVTQPFMVGVSNAQGTNEQDAVVVGGNEGCASLFGYWHYPAGGAPYKGKSGPFDVGGAAVSLATP